MDVIIRFFNPGEIGELGKQKCLLEGTLVHDEIIVKVCKKEISHTMEQLEKMHYTIEDKITGRVLYPLKPLMISEKRPTMDYQWCPICMQTTRHSRSMCVTCRPKSLEG